LEVKNDTNMGGGIHWPKKNVYTIFKEIFKEIIEVSTCMAISSMVEHWSHKPVVVGSNPALPMLKFLVKK